MTTAACLNRMAVNLSNQLRKKDNLPNQLRKS